MSIYKKVTLRFILYIVVPTLAFVLGVILGSARTTELYNKEFKKEFLIDKYYVLTMDTCEICIPSYYRYMLADTAHNSDPFEILLPGTQYKNDTFLLIIK